MHDAVFPSAVIDTLTLLMEPAQVVELRALDVSTPDYRRPHTVSGYFDDMAKLADAALKLRQAKGLYVTLNPVNPALLARAANRVRDVREGESTPDTYVLRRRWLPIDCDPVRPSGIAATGDEHQAGLSRAGEISATLRAAGWPDSIAGDGGNSGHLLYLVDLPNDDESRALLQRCLEALAFRFNDLTVVIDQTVHNAARIWRLYGTVNRKGDDIPERPHRLARLLRVPDNLIPVSRALLEALVRSLPEPKEPKQSVWQGRERPFDLDRWIPQHGLDVVGPHPWKQGRKWIFSVCPWNPDHRNRSAFILEFPSGGIDAGCHHNGCVGKDWPALRDMVEPGWHERRARNTQRNAQPASGTFGSAITEESADWPEPLSLPNPLPDIEPFEPRLLPEAFRPWIEDIAERMQCPMDFPAVSVMVAISSVVGRKVVIRPKKRDDWRVVANLWGGVVGRPGVLKTPAIQEPLRPLWRLEYDADLTYQELVEQWKVQQVLAKEQEKVSSQKIRDTLKKGLDATSIAETLVSAEDRSPSRHRYIVNDSTVEKLGELLNENPNGLLVFRDELTGFLRQLDRDGHESDRAFYLEAWNGHGRFKYDRISRGTIDIEAACVSILGGIQPGPLGHYLRSALQGGEGDDGLMQRFQLLVWPDISKEWTNIDRWPDSDARKNAYEVFSRLNKLTAIDIRAEPDEDLDGIPYVRFSAEAQDIFDEWRAKLEVRLRQSHAHPAIEAHLAKYRSLIPSLALLIHLADHGKNPVGVDAIERACAWGEYLESHARRVYSQGLTPDDMAARALADRILSEDLTDAFTARDVYRRHWAGLDTREDAQKGIDVLVELGWLVEVRETTGGRPSIKYVINPRVKEISQ